MQGGTFWDAHFVTVLGFLSEWVCERSPTYFIVMAVWCHGIHPSIHSSIHVAQGVASYSKLVVQ